MLASNLPHFGTGRFGFHSRHLLRTSHRVDLQSEPLESRRLLATNPVQAAASANPSGDIPTDTSPASTSSSAVASPPATAQASPPVNNSSATNTPGVSPTVPASANVVTDDSPSVTTSPSADITALIPNTSPFTPSPENPVFLVPTAVDPMTTELSVPTLNLQENNSALAFPQSGVPIILHPITSPLSVQNNNVAVSPQASIAPMPTPAQNPQQPVGSEHIGQELETELQKPLRLELAPHPEVVLPKDVFGPAQTPTSAQPSATEATKDTKPKAIKPDTDAPRMENRQDDAPPAKKTVPADEASPRQQPTPMQMPIPWSVPGLTLGIPLPERNPAPVFPTPSTKSMGDQTGLAALFGAVVVAGGGLHLAMGESARFGMHWLPDRVASPRSARPRSPNR